ncbi:hypothetical protein D3C76_1438960 [compost metagenome]
MGREFGPDLGDNLHFTASVAVLTQPFANDGFRLAAAIATGPHGIGVCGIEGVDTEFKRSVE